jgi:hypothetical protein
MLDATMDGPIVLAKLAPGTYTIRATSGSQALTQTVTIPAQGLRQVNFRWDTQVRFLRMRRLWLAAPALRRVTP